MKLLAVALEPNGWLCSHEVQDSVLLCASVDDGRPALVPGRKNTVIQSQFSVCK